MLCFQFLYRTQSCILIFFHIIVPCPIELKQLVLLDGVYAGYFRFLLHHKLLAVPSHFLILDLQGFLVGFFCLNVHAGLLAFFAVIVEESEELDHPVVNQILMGIGIEFSFVEESQKFVEGDHLFSYKDDSVKQIIAENQGIRLLPEQSRGILQFNVAQFAFVNFVELLQQVLKVALIIILLHFVNIIIQHCSSLPMFFTLSDRNHTFQRREISRLISVVPLCARTVILFCDDLNFYHYSLMDEKILYQSKLPGRVRSAISISGHEILCPVIETRSLILLNIKQKSIDEICKLPQTKVFNEGRERDILTQITLNLFEKSSFFYLYEPNQDENKAKVIFHGPSNKQRMRVDSNAFISKEFATKKIIIKKLDSISKLVAFNQEIEDNGQFKFQTINCQTKFEDKEVVCHHPAFTRFSIVKEIKAIEKEGQTQTFLIFVNSSEPTILIYTQDNVIEYQYKPNRIFLSTVLVNAELGFGMFMFMPDPQDQDPDYSSIIELVSLETGVVQDCKKCNVHQIVKSFEDDYLLHYRPENSPSDISVFRTDHIINKKAHYMKMMEMKGLKDVSSELAGLIIKSLQN